MTFADYLILVATRYGRETSWRMGQTYFNVLYEHKPEWANRIRATSLDPFHNDVVLPKFLEWLATFWEDNS